jgi:hypothetical protein
MDNAPRGIRNNNPGNIRWGAPWQGLVPEAQRTDTDFCQFVAAAWGVRAIAVILITYQDKRRAPDGSAIDTVDEFISRWAPAVENNTSAYVQAVASALGVGADDPTVDVHRYDTLLTLVRAIITHENGQAPKGDWYAQEVYDEGLRLAGVVKARPRHLPSPLALVTTTGGTAALAESVSQVQPVLDAVGRVAHSTAGLPQWLRLVGFALVAASLAVAGWAWLKQRRALQAVHP